MRIRGSAIYRQNKESKTEEVKSLLGNFLQPHHAGEKKHNLWPYINIIICISACITILLLYSMQLFPAVHFGRQESVLLVIPGHGNQTRYGIMKRSIQKLAETLPSYECVIFGYKSPKTYTIKPVSDCEIVLIEGGSWLNFLVAASAMSKNHDYVFVLIDDVEVFEFDFQEFTSIMKENQLSAAALRVFNVYWPQANGRAREFGFYHSLGLYVRHADIQANLFTADTFRCWTNLFNFEINPIGWGYDMLLSHQCHAQVGYIYLNAYAVHRQELGTTMDTSAESYKIKGDEMEAAMHRHYKVAGLRNFIVHNLVRGYLKYPSLYDREPEVCLFSFANNIALQSAQEGVQVILREESRSRMKERLCEGSSDDDFSLYYDFWSEAVPKEEICDFIAIVESSALRLLPKFTRVKQTALESGGDVISINIQTQKFKPYPQFTQKKLSRTKSRVSNCLKYFNSWTSQCQSVPPPIYETFGKVEYIHEAPSLITDDRKESWEKAPTEVPRIGGFMIFRAEFVPRLLRAISAMQPNRTCVSPVAFEDVISFMRRNRSQYGSATFVKYTLPP